MGRILIVTEGLNHMLVSLEASLKKLAYEVGVISADLEAVGGLTESVDGMLLYADEHLIEQQKGLHLLKDKIVTDDIPICVLGKSENIRALKAMIPKDLIQLEFVRPINIHINELAGKIDALIAQNTVRKKILVVDDSGASLRLVKQWLEDKYSVFLANSAAMAIRHVTLNRPDLILLDYEMPVCDGKQVLEMIRTETEFSDIPVIFLTNKSDRESIMQVKELRPEGYLLKTMEPQMIVRSIDDFFALQKVQI